jgi:hypothetical protein
LTEFHRIFGRVKPTREQIARAAIDDDQRCAGCGDSRQLAEHAEVRVARVLVATQSKARVLVQMVDGRMEEQNVELCLGEVAFLEASGDEPDALEVQALDGLLELFCCAGRGARLVRFESYYLVGPSAGGVERVRSSARRSDVEHPLSCEIDVAKQVLEVEPEIARVRDPLRHELEVVVDGARQRRTALQRLWGPRR